MTDITQLSDQELMAIAGDVSNIQPTLSAMPAMPARRMRPAIQDLRDELGGNLDLIGSVAPAKQSQTMPSIPQDASQEPDLSQLSDDELMAAAGIKPEPTPVPVNPLQEAFEKKKAGLGRTILDQSLQGATFGFSDEISDAVGAGLAKLVVGGNYGDLYKQARDLSKEQLAAELNDRPFASIAANLGGGLLTGVASGTTKAGAAITNRIASGGTAAKAAKAAIAGAASGGLYGAGVGQDGERLSSAGSGVAVGALLGPVVPLAGAGLKSLNTKKIVPSSDEIRTLGSKLFKQAEAEGGVILPDAADKFRDKVMNTLNLEGEAKIFASNPAAQKIAEQIGQFKGKPLNFETAKAIDEHLGDLAYDTMDTFGKLDSNGKKFLDLQRELRDAMDTLPNSPTIKEARKLWSASLKMQDVERILKKADGKEQPVTIIKNGFNALLNRGDKLKGYSKEEITAIEKAAQTGLVTDALKLAGSGLVPIASGVTGAAGGPLGAAIGAATGYAVQQGSKAVGVARQTSRAKGVSEAIAKNAGLYKEQQRLQIPNILKKSPAIVDKTAPVQKLLPAPAKKEEFISGRAGVRQATSEEIAKAEAARKRASELGITPDVSKVNARNEVRSKNNPVLDKLEKEFSEKKAAQIEEMYKKSTPSVKAKIGQIIEKQNRDGVERGALGDLIVKALREGDTKKPLRITVRPSDKRK
jgi:hypothetical protein